MNDGYTNPIDNIIKYMESEIDRRIKALDSNEHCDNDTIRRNIITLNCGVLSMKRQRAVDRQNGHV